MLSKEDNLHVLLVKLNLKCYFEGILVNVVKPSRFLMFQVVGSSFLSLIS